MGGSRCWLRLHQQRDLQEYLECQHTVLGVLGLLLLQCQSSLTSPKLINREGECRTPARNKQYMYLTFHRSTPRSVPPIHLQSTSPTSCLRTFLDTHQAPMGEPWHVLRAALAQMLCARTLSSRTSQLLRRVATEQIMRLLFVTASMISAFLVSIQQAQRLWLRLQINVVSHWQHCRRNRGETEWRYKLIDTCCIARRPSSTLAFITGKISVSLRDEGFKGHDNKIIHVSSK